jgi:hypothetical protein
MTLLFRWLIFAAVTAATMTGATRDTRWRTGTFRIDGADDEGWNGFGVSAARKSPGNQSYNPLTESVVFDISSEGGSYRASITGVPIDRSVTYEELFPWLRDVPPQVRFRTKGKTIYFLDLKNKQHKADILLSPEPHSSRK